MQSVNLPAVELLVSIVFFTKKYVELQPFVAILQWHIATIKNLKIEFHTVLVILPPVFLVQDLKQLFFPNTNKLIDYGIIKELV